MWQHTVRRLPQKNTTTMQRTVCGLLLIFGTDAGVYSHGDNTKQFVTRATWGMGRYGDLTGVAGDPFRGTSRCCSRCRRDQGLRDSRTGPPAARAARERCRVVRRSVQTGHRLSLSTSGA
jgi:hypothetical protein